MSLFANAGQYQLIHIIAISTIATGLFIATTASGLGALAAIVVFMGIYSIAFGAIMEFVLLLRVLLAWGARRWLIKYHGQPSTPAIGGL